MAAVAAAGEQGACPQKRCPALILAIEIQPMFST